MAKVRTFRITKDYGVPDKDITEFLEECEKDAYVNVLVVQIPAFGFAPDGVTPADPRLTFVVTKVEDK